MIANRVYRIRYILAGLLAAPALWVILFFAMAMGE